MEEEVLRFVKNTIQKQDILENIWYNKSMNCFRVKRKYWKYFIRAERKIKRYCPTAQILLAKSTNCYVIYFVGKNKNVLFSTQVDTIHGLKDYMAILLSNVKEYFNDNK